MRKNTVLAGMIIMIVTRAQATLSVCAENNKTKPTAVTGPGKLTLIVKAEKGNYVPYSNVDGKLTPWTPTHGTINSDGKGTEFNVDLVISQKNDRKSTLYISEGGTLLLLRMNSTPGSFTMCKVQVTLTKENMFEFATVQTMTGRMFKNEQNKVVVPVLTGTPLETLLAEVCKQTNIVKQLQPEDVYDLLKAGAGLHENAGVVTGVKDKVTTILTVGADKKPVTANVVWNKTDDVNALLDNLGLGTALRYEKLTEDTQPKALGAELWFPTEVTA